MCIELFWGEEDFSIDWCHLMPYIVISHCGRNYVLIFYFNSPTTLHIYYFYVYLQDFKQAQNSSPDILHRRLCCGVSLRNLYGPWIHQRAARHLKNNYKMARSNDIVTEMGRFCVIACTLFVPVQWCPAGWWSGACCSPQRGPLIAE